ncbi:MAG: DUF6952 family protein [Flavobacteriaceae bacterium]
MKLPLIKHIVQFIEEYDEDYIEESLEVLEHLSDFSGIKEEEVDVLGEMISNLYGALEVHKEMKSGVAKKEALNNFMRRVQGSIDT